VGVAAAAAAVVGPHCSTPKSANTKRKTGRERFKLRAVVMVVIIIV